MFYRNKRPINWDEFDALKEIVGECVSYALRDSKLELNRRQIYSLSKVDKTLIDDLMGCYKKSNFAKNVEPEYIEFVRTEIIDILCNKLGPAFSDRDRMKIIIPVAFYSLITQNESNQKTVVRRRNKVYSAAANGKSGMSWNKRNPYERQLDMYFEEDQKEVARFVRAINNNVKLAEDYHFFENAFVSDQCKEAGSKVSNICEYLRFVHYCSDVARSGKFLLDILSVVHDEKNPLNTIIIMGCINYLTELFTGTRFLIAGNREDWGYRRNGRRKKIKRDFTVSDMLDEYMIDKYGYYFKHEETAVLPILYTGSDEVPQTKMIYKNTKIRKKERFGIYYSHIKNNYEFDIADFVSCFLDQEVFNRFLEIDVNLLQDIKALQKIMKMLPDLQRAEEAADRIIRVSNLFEGNQTFLSKKFNYYEWLDKDGVVIDRYDLEDSYSIQHQQNMFYLRQLENRKV